MEVGTTGASWSIQLGGTVSTPQMTRTHVNMRSRWIGGQNLPRLSTSEPVESRRSEDFPWKVITPSRDYFAKPYISSNFTRNVG